ncbi:MAG TPA: FAD-dependent thymidylate synthase [Terriglobales bacterium]|jgi:thymidylate synthase ThyX
MQTSPAVSVYAIHGTEPEVQAYAMAKYSRSALSMKESLKEISSQKAEQFLNTFYFQYGHRSIADLAHIAFAIERLSILAAIVLVDEQRWDGQERSTRYQNFKKSGWYTPELPQNAASLYEETARFLFEEYEAVSKQSLEYLKSVTPKPPDMDEGYYERTLKARAFDVGRYLLPLATNTSLGQIVNARTLETQISRLLAHTHFEVRQLGELLREAAKQPAYDVNWEQAERLVNAIEQTDRELGEKARQQWLKPVRVSGTLVKYTAPNEYAIRSREMLTQAASELMQDAAIESANLVDLLEEDEPLDVQLATSLLYAYCHCPYRQIRDRVAALSSAQRKEIIDLDMQSRGRHDELSRPYSAGQRFRFDILMDIGGFRDMHRHRRCVQIEQAYTTAHGHAIPEEIAPAGLYARYAASLQRVFTAHQRIGAEAPESADYVLPLAVKKRTLFCMDFAEAVYITELRTGVAGHKSYRDVAYAMYEAVAQRYPALAGYFRVTDVREPVDLLKR